MKPRTEAQIEIAKFRQRMKDCPNDRKVKRVDFYYDGERVSFPNVPGLSSIVDLTRWAVGEKGRLYPETASRMLDIYGCYLVRDAREHPGRHNGIDFLFKVAEGEIPAPKAEVKRYGPVERLHPRSREETFRRVARKFGTPSYVTFERDVRERARLFMSQDVLIRYAVKANTEAALIAMLNQERVHFDTATFNEDHRLIEGPARIPGDKIRHTSQQTAPSREELEFVIRNRIHYTASSIDQLREYAKANPGGSVGLRINIRGSGWRPTMSTGGELSSFGIYPDERTMREVDRILKHYHMRVDTIGFHVGSGNDPEEQKKAMREGLVFVRKYNPKRYDVGGGLKVKGAWFEHETDVNEIGKAMREIRREYYRETGKKLIMELEPGTSMIANQVYMLTRVMQAKTTTKRAPRFLILDGGMGIFLRPQLYGAHHPADPIFMSDRPRIIEPTICMGPECESGSSPFVDLEKPELFDPRLMPTLYRGDLVVFERGGAYTMTMNSPHYNSGTEAGSIYVRRNGVLTLTREVEPVHELWRHESVPKEFLGK